jgi:hypothetical protein
VEEACDSATFRGQAVVRRQRGVGLLAYDRHSTCFEQRQRFWRDFKSAVAAAAEDHQIGLVVQQLSHVCAENAWSVIGAGFAPVPRSAATRPQLGVAEPAESLDLDEAPTVVDHPGRHLAHTREASALAQIAIVGAGRVASPQSSMRCMPTLAGSRAAAQ